LTFLPLFIVIDALGNLPFVIPLSEGMSKPERRKIIHVVVITATTIGLVFLFFGQFTLKMMGISVGAFTIAGGFILLVLSTKYMSMGENGGNLKRGDSSYGSYWHTIESRINYYYHPTASGNSISDLHGFDTLYCEYDYPRA